MITQDTALIQAQMKAVIAAISSLRAPVMPGEYDLHAMIAGALADSELSFDHEYRLAPRCRIDFKVGNIGVEVKKGRPDRKALLPQLTRYLSSPELGGLIVVCQRAIVVPNLICAKPVLCTSLNRLWGVALP